MTHTERPGLPPWPGPQFPLCWLGAVPVIVTPAEIDISNSEQLAAALLTAALGHPDVTVVDMTSTTFCGCSALRVLVQAWVRARAHGRDLRLAGVSPAVLRVFEVTGLDETFAIYGTVAGALTWT